MSPPTSPTPCAMQPGGCVGAGVGLMQLAGCAVAALELMQPAGCIAAGPGNCVNATKDPIACYGIFECKQPVDAGVVAMQNRRTREL